MGIANSTNMGTCEFKDVDRIPLKKDVDRIIFCSFQCNKMNMKVDG